MTTFGKVLAFVNLVLGIGIAMYSITVYSQRPTWFDKDVPDTVDKGNVFYSFKQLEAEIKSLGTAAIVESNRWGDQLRDLEKREAVRADRKAKFAQRLAMAREGNKADKAKGEPGFYEYVMDPASNLIDVNRLGPVVLGPDGQPLKGANTLLATFNSDTKLVESLAREVQKLRQDFEAVGIEVVDAELRLLKQTEIREQLLAELLALSASEVNVYEERETVLRRLKQLKGRLGIFDKKGN